MYITTTRWFAAPVEQTALQMSTAAEISRWFAPLNEADDGELSSAGSPWAGHIGSGRWSTEVRGAVRRRIRETVDLRAHADDGTEVGLYVSASPWDGGTMLHLALSVEGPALRRLNRPWPAGLRRDLDRSIDALGALLAPRGRTLGRQRAATARNRDALPSPTGPPAATA